MMSSKRKLSVFSILSLIGFFLSAALSIHFYSVRSGLSSFHSSCNFSSSWDCDAVALSSYAEGVLGIPLSSFSAGWFLAALLLSLIARDLLKRKMTVRLLLGMSAVSALFSVFYLGVMMFRLKTFCLLCLGVDLVSWGSLGVAFFLDREFRSSAAAPSHQHSPQKFLWAWIAVCMAGSILFLRLWQETSFSQREIDRAVQEILDEKKVALEAHPLTPSLGPVNAPIEIVEFSDFQCPYCQKGAYTLSALTRKYPGKIRILFKNYPLNSACNRKVQHRGHEFACEAARAAMCAQRFQRFEPVYEKLFESQERLSSKTIRDILAQSGLSESEISSCQEISSDSPLQTAIAKDIEEAIALEIESTPTFFINGHRVRGAFPLPVWSRLVERLQQP